MIKLVLEEKGAIRPLEVESDSLTIGRAAENAVRIADTSSSRSHCKIERADGGFFVEDLESRNGTTLNGEPLRGRRLLATGDRIGIGEATLHYGERLHAPAPPRARFALTSLEGFAAGRVFKLCSFPCVIGRRAGISLVLEDDSISPEHCMLVEDAGSVFVVDLNSQGGTLLDGSPIKVRAKVAPGSVLSLGKTKLRLDDLIAPAPVAVPAPVPVPDAVPVAIPAPVAVLAPVPVPDAVPVAVPAPVQVPDPVPIAAPVPVPVPDPVAVPAPAPVSSPSPSPVVSPLQVPAVAASPSPEAPKPERKSLEDYLAPEDDPIEEMARGVVRATPWWLISLAFHGVVLACFPLVILSYRIIEEEKSTPVILRVNPPVVVKIDLGDRPHAVLEQAGLPESDEKLTDEPRVFFPQAPEADHNESANEEDHGSMKGESLDGLSYLAGMESGVKGRKPWQNMGVEDRIGVGSGSGGSKRFGTRFGGRMNLVARGGGSLATESSVEAGLRWLARHQFADGRWSASLPHGDPKLPFCKGSEPPRPGDPTHDVGVTALAVLAFLGAGHTPNSRAAYADPITGKTMRFGDAVAKGLTWLVEQQGESGAICDGRVRELLRGKRGMGLMGMGGISYAYDHALATWALCEGYGLTEMSIYKQPAQKAVSYLEEVQTKDAGWRHVPGSNQSDTSVTGFCVMALKSARISGLEVKESSFDGARAFLKYVTCENGAVGYTSQQGASTFQPSLTAVGMVCRLFMDHDRSDPALEKGAALVGASLPAWAPTTSTMHNSYYWYAGTIALFQYDGPSGPLWRKWNDALVKALCENQHRRADGCLEGSWDSDGDMFCSAGGRPCSTAMNVLSLEIYYRYASVFSSKEK